MKRYLIPDQLHKDLCGYPQARVEAMYGLTYDQIMHILSKAGFNSVETVDVLDYIVPMRDQPKAVSVYVEPRQPNSKKPQKHDFEKMMARNNVKGLAKIYKVSTQTIRTWMRTFGLEPESKIPVTRWDLSDKVTKHGKEGAAKEYGVSVDQIIAWMRLSGIADKNPTWKIPIKEEIEPLLNRYTLYEIAQMYCVTPQTVSVWIKRLEIKRKPAYKK